LKGKHSYFFIYIACIAAISGILFGYDTGVISGAILFIEKEFQLSPQMNGIVVSSVLIGAFLGAVCSGRLSDYFGRRNLLIVDALIFGIGSIGCALSQNVGMLIAFRMFVGLAIGVASYVAPLYISEIAPPKYRGALVSLNQLAIAFGIFVSYIVDYYFAGMGQWRGMFAAGVVPAICLLIGMIFLPYSPRWMAAQGKEDKALEILQAIRGDENIQEEYQRILKNLKVEKGGWKLLFSKHIRVSLWIGIALAVAQQVTGINTIIYYAPTIFQMAGYEEATAAIFATVGVGAVFFFSTFIATAFLDKWGRRPLLMTGQIGMAIGLLGLSWMFFHMQHELFGDMALISMLLYIACFGFSMGPIMWLMIAEIYPLRVRGLGSSVATCANWGSNWLVTFTFLTLVEFAGSGTTFLIYFFITILSIVFVWFYIPETKGVTLEEIEEKLMKGVAPRHIGS